MLRPVRAWGVPGKQRSRTLIETELSMLPVFTGWHAGSVLRPSALVLRF